MPRQRTTLTDVRRNNTRSTLRSAYMPAINPAMGDPLNTLGSQVGMIRDMPMEPLPPVGAYASGAGLRRAQNEMPNTPLRYTPGIGTQVTGHNAFSGGFQAQPSPADAWSLRNPDPYTKASPARMEVPNRNVRSGSNQDAASIALNRMRGGMSLNRDERLLLQGMDPATIQGAYSGSFADRKAQAKETVRQRGLARGDARAAGRAASGNYRASIRGGMPANIAGALSLTGAGGVDPMAATLAGLMPGGTAAAFNETNARSRADDLNRTADADKTRQAGLIAGLQSEDPAIRQAAASQLGLGPQTGNGFSLTTPNPDGTPNLGFNNDDLLAMENRRGDDFMIAQYGKSKGWSADKIAAAQREYGSSILDRGADWLYNNAPRAAKSASRAIGNAPVAAGSWLRSLRGR